MQKAPLVSVIMPTYNHAEFITEAIDSVFRQTYKRVELIIINNHSTDNTEKIVNSFDDERIKYLRFQNRGIIAASRNLGIKNSNGKYIAFLDSDDIWLPEKLEKQVELMESNVEMALSYVLFSKLHQNGIIKGEFPYPTHRVQGNVFRNLYMQNVIANSGAMVRASVLKEVGLFDENPKLVSVEDAELWLRISRTRNVGLVDKDTLLIYRVGGNNIYYRKLYKKHQRRMYLAMKYLKYVGIHSFLKKILIIPIYRLYENLFIVSQQGTIFKSETERF